MYLAEQLFWYVKDQLIRTIDIQVSYRLRRKHLQGVLCVAKTSSEKFQQNGTSSSPQFPQFWSNPCVSSILCHFLVL